MFDNLSILGYPGTDKSFCQYDTQSVVEIKDLRTETSKHSPSGGKRLVEAMKHYSGDKVTEAPLRMRKM